MDISKIANVVAKDEEGAVVPILQKDGEPYTGADGSPASVTVVGSESKKFRAAKDAIGRRMLRSRKARLEPADFERNRIEQAAACVVAWSGWEENGEPLPCTAENVKKILAFDHILEQVEAGIVGHADFFANSSAS